MNSLPDEPVYLRRLTALLGAGFVDVWAVYGRALPAFVRQLLDRLMLSRSASYPVDVAQFMAWARVVLALFRYDSASYDVLLRSKPGTMPAFTAFTDYQHCRQPAIRRLLRHFRVRLQHWVPSCFFRHLAGLVMDPPYMRFHRNLRPSPCDIASLHQSWPKSLDDSVLHCTSVTLGLLNVVSFCDLPMDQQSLYRSSHSTDFLAHYATDSYRVATLALSSDMAASDQRSFLQRLRRVHLLQRSYLQRVTALVTRLQDLLRLHPSCPFAKAAEKLLPMTYIASPTFEHAVRVQFRRTSLFRQLLFYFDALYAGTDVECLWAAQHDVYIRHPCDVLLPLSTSTFSELLKSAQSATWLDLDFDGPRFD